MTLGSGRESWHATLVRGGPAASSTIYPDHFPLAADLVGRPYVTVEGTQALLNAALTRARSALLAVWQVANVQLSRRRRARRSAVGGELALAASLLAVVAAAVGPAGARHASSAGPVPRGPPRVRRLGMLAPQACDAPGALADAPSDAGGSRHGGERQRGLGARTGTQCHLAECGAPDRAPLRRRSIRSRDSTPAVPPKQARA
jgi:hypothetical protein